MAYKFQKGAFAASGSVSLEEGLNVTGSSALAAVTATTISGTTVQFTTVSASTLGGAAVSGLTANYVPTFNPVGGTFVNSLIQSNPVASTITFYTGSGNVTLQVTGAVTTSQAITAGNGLTVSAGNLAVSAGTLSASNGVLGGGTSTLNDLTINGNLTILGTTISASVQNLVIEDKQIVLADGAANASAAAGAGFFVSGANVQLTYKQNGAGTAAASGDIFQFSGSSAFTSVQAKTFYGDLVGSMNYSVTGIGDANQNPLSTGINYANASFGATRTWTLPNLPATGSSVMVKGPSNLTPVGFGGFQLIVAAPAGYDIDGDSTVTLESSYAAIECVFVGGPSGGQWKIF
jgi:phage baseplate assembly protein gpV